MCATFISVDKIMHFFLCGESNVSDITTSFFYTIIKLCTCVRVGGGLLDFHFLFCLHFSVVFASTLGFN